MNINLHDSDVYLFVTSFRPEYMERQLHFTLRHFDRNTWSVSGMYEVEKSVPPNDNYYNYRFLHYAYYLHFLDCFAGSQ